jgi:hypothetical protein
MDSLSQKTLKDILLSGHRLKSSELVMSEVFRVINQQCSLIKHLTVQPSDVRVSKLICFSARKSMLLALTRLKQANLHEFSRLLTYIFHTLANEPVEIAAELFWFIGDLVTSTFVSKTEHFLSLTLDACNDHCELITKLLTTCKSLNNPYTVALSVLVMIEKISSCSEAKILLSRIDVHSFLISLFNHSLQGRAARAFLFIYNGEQPSVVLSKSTHCLLQLSIKATNCAVRNILLIFLKAIYFHLLVHYFCYSMR